MRDKVLVSFEITGPNEKAIFSFRNNQLTTGLTIYEHFSRKLKIKRKVSLVLISFRVTVLGKRESNEASCCFMASFQSFYVFFIFSAKFLKLFFFLLFLSSKLLFRRFILFHFIFRRLLRRITQ